MRLVDCYVTKVRSKPVLAYGKWWVEVEFIGYGVAGRHSLLFDTKHEGLEVEEGFHFLA